MGESAPQPEVRSLIDRLYVAINDHDVQALAEVADPEIEWSDPPGLAGGGTVKGPAAVIERLDEFEELAGLRYGAEDLIDDGDRAMARTTVTGRGQGSGLPIEGEFFSVFEISGGRITRQAAFFDRAEAERRLEGGFGS